MRPVVVRTVARAAAAAHGILADGVLALDLYGMREPFAGAGLVDVDRFDELEPATT